MKAIKTKFHGPTNSNGSRISADDGEGNKIITSYDHGLSFDGNHRESMLMLCEKMSWPYCVECGWYKNNCYWVIPENQ